MVLEFAKRNRLVTTVVLTYAFLFLALPTQAMKSISHSLYYLKEMLQVLPIIFVLTAVIEAWVPKELIIRRLGDSSGVYGNLLSLLLGSISVGPIYAAFPISKMLINKGASIGNIVILLSSWAVIKIPMLANEAKFLGLKFMAARWLLTVIAIVIMARIVAMLMSRADIPVSVESEQQQDIAVSDAYCIGCGICVKLLPEALEMKHGKAAVKATSFKADQAYLAQLAGKCPTHALLFKERATTKV